LFGILAPGLQEKASRVAREEEMFDSILHCYYPAHNNGRINGEAKSIHYRSSKVIYPF
jgi:hypothetical protein